MILAVTLNAALDVTYTVHRLDRHTSHRVREVTARAGGKGVNVARVLSSLGHEVLATGLFGGPDGERLRADLAAAGIPDGFLEVTGQTRRTVTVVDGDATVFNEPGPMITAEEWVRFEDAYVARLQDARAVALCGSLPPGVPPDAYARLAATARAAGIPVVLDTSGDALLRGLAGRPQVVKPNAAELDEVLPGAGIDAAASHLRERGADAVVVSLGAEGLHAVTGDGVWSARPPQEVRGNPTGAGDAVVAGIAVGLAESAPWPELLVNAVALGAAAVLAPLAGDVDPHAYQRFAALVRPERENLHATDTHR